MRRSWFRWRSTYRTLTTADDPKESAPATPAAPFLRPEHLAALVASEGVGHTWSDRALWSALDHLRTTTCTGVTLERAWTDGPDAFCIVYGSPLLPGQLIGVRRHVADTESAACEPDAEPGYARFVSPMFGAVGADGRWEPENFGSVVAGYDVDEPLGRAAEFLRMDASGVGWWGALRRELPRRPADGPSAIQFGY